MVACLLFMAVLFTTSNINVFAHDSEKTNFDFINISENGDVEYTYQENGKEYKVKEYANIDLTEVTTYIYELDEDNDYRLISNYVTNVKVKGDTIEIVKTDEKNVVATEKILINDIVESNNGSKVNTRAVTNGWVHIYNYSGSVKFAKYTLSVVIAILGGALAGLSGNTWVTTGAIGGVSQIAQIIVEERIPYAYIKQEGHYWYENGYPCKKMKLISKCYKNSNGTGFMGTTTQINTILEGGN